MPLRRSAAGGPTGTSGYVNWRATSEPHVRWRWPTDQWPGDGVPSTLAPQVPTSGGARRTWPGQVHLGTLTLASGNGHWQVPSFEVVSDSESSHLTSGS